MIVTVLLLVFFIPVSIIILFYIRSVLAYRHLSSYGIQGPSPQLYYGNAKQFRKQGLLEFLKDNTIKYGAVFSLYNGVEPNIVVSDLDMLQQILVKQFNIFMDRAAIPNIVQDRSAPKGLLTSKGADWERRRRIVSRGFNTIKLKKMSGAIGHSCDNLCNKMEEHCDTKKSVDVWKLYGLFTMEVILAGGFGHNVQVINGKAEDQLTKSAAEFFTASRGKYGVWDTITLLSNFPFLLWYVRHKAMKSQIKRNNDFVEDKITEFVEKRRSLNEERQDLLQLLMDARAESDDEGDEDIPIAQRKLTDEEIVRTALSFLLAGYETTSNALAYTTYLLATHPSEQDKLCQEIDKYFNEHQDASLYDAAQNITYLDMIVQESLRMYPPAPITTRYCSKNVIINGVTIPKGVNVIVPIHTIHYSTEHWQEPHVFNPNRFSPEGKSGRHSMAHMPFGWGRRSCIAMRLALMEAKMALVSIYRQYKLVEGPETEKPLKTTVGITASPENGVHVLIESRL